MSLTFYYSPFSSATTTHWALEELGIPYEKVKLDLDKGEQRKPEFLALNPNGKVPVLVHDGAPVFESIAILVYLGETFGVERGLFPPPGGKRAEALAWLVWSNVSIGAALARFQHASSDRIPKDEHNAKAAASAKAEIEKLLGVLDRALTGKEYLVGGSFSIVDVHVSGFAEYLGMCGFDTKRWPAIEAWVKRCSSRPAHARTWRPDA